MLTTSKRWQSVVREGHKVKLPAGSCAADRCFSYEYYMNITYEIYDT